MRRCLFFSFLCTLTQAQELAKFHAALEFVSDFVLNRHSQDYGVDRRHGLSVIGAGFGRTGTKSLEAALREQHHQVYDTRSMLEHGDAAGWIQCATEWQAKTTGLPTCRQMVEKLEEDGYTATLDFPMNLMAPILFHLRPEGKVLMSVRDNEEKWFQSWRNVCATLGHLYQRPWKWVVGDFTFPATIMKILYDIEWEQTYYPEHVARPVPWFELLHTQPFFDTPQGKAAWIGLHKRFQRELQETIPSSQLLIFNVKQGWSPLVDFLGFDEGLKGAEFPFVNDLKSLVMVRNIMDVIACGLPFWIGLVFYGIIRWVRWARRQMLMTMKKIKVL